MTGWEEFRKYKNLLIASAAIAIAVLAMLFMQYHSLKRTQEHAQKTMKANLELHLFEISEEAKRKMLDHANHITHSVRQQYIRDRDLPRIRQALSRLTMRFPEVEDCFVVFFETEQKSETWQVLKFVRPNIEGQNTEVVDGIPLGNFVEEAKIAEAIKRAWQAIPQKEPVPLLYSAYDPNTFPENPRQLFLHSVHSITPSGDNNRFDSVGIVGFSTRIEQFPSKDYLHALVAKHQDRDKEINDLIGILNYAVMIDRGGNSQNVVSTDPGDATMLTRRFDDSDKLFPNLTFGVSAPAIEAQTYAGEYIRSSITLGLIAAVVAIIGLGLTWRATRREMQLAQAKSEFLANMSHELKTPLTAIRAFGDLLHSGRATRPERIQEYGGIIKKETDRLTSLINNILEMSRMERGIRKYRLVSGDLRDTVADTVNFFQHLPEVSNFEIHLTVPKDPVITRFDEGAIRQAVINLLSNSVKYSGVNQPLRVNVELKQTTNAAIIEVVDFGVGIPVEEQCRIFQPFHRVENDEIQAKGGTGLGLAIVQEIALGHDGEISVESEVGVGSTFCLILPLPDEKEYEEQREHENGKYFGYRRRA